MSSVDAGYCYGEIIPISIDGKIWVHLDTILCAWFDKLLPLAIRSLWIWFDFVQSSHVYLSCSFVWFGTKFTCVFVLFVCLILYKVHMCIFLVRLFGFVQSSYKWVRTHIVAHFILSWIYPLASDWVWQMATHWKKQKIVLIMSKKGNWWWISLYFGMSIV